MHPRQVRQQKPGCIVRQTQASASAKLGTAMPSTSAVKAGRLQCSTRATPGRPAPSPRGTRRCLLCYGGARRLQRGPFSQTVGHGDI
jgi:hypothetical protein